MQAPSQNQIVTIRAGPVRLLSYMQVGSWLSATPRFDADMPLIGWSMTKMAINALAGDLGAGPQIKA